VYTRGRVLDLLLTFSNKLLLQLHDVQLLLVLRAVGRMRPLTSVEWKTKAHVADMALLWLECHRKPASKHVLSGGQQYDNIAVESNRANAPQIYALPDRRDVSSRR
jgi:hypothetical protein